MERVGKRNAGALLLLQLISFWPVWHWYMVRILDRSDEPWGVIALLTAGAFLIARRRATAGEALRDSRVMIAPLSFAVAYTLLFPFLPSLGQAALGILAVGSFLSILLTGQAFHAGIWGLLILSLPIIPTLQFYFGYPLRVLTAFAAEPFIELFGVEVQRSGTCLQWAGELILVDAPCSGIKMLWSTMYLTYTLSSLYWFNIAQTFAASCFASLVLFAGNTVRVIVLFFFESGLVDAPRGAHSAVGVLIFTIVSLSVVCGARLISRRS